ncbi:hypothetical protein Tco_1427804 [Tanacetum coccineum]
MMRLYHRLIACSIVGRSQAPEKVTVTDLFYLRGMDVGSVNIPYLLARYLRRFASGRKQGAMISGGQFIARPTEHFGLLTEERLQGLIVIVRDLLVIDIAELARLHISGAPEIVEGAPDVVEGDQAVPAPVSLGEQREVVDAIARDFSRFIVWAARGISQLLDSAGATYVRYSKTHVPYQRRRARQRTDEANTSTAPLDKDQPDP